MKKVFILPVFATVLILSGCLPSFGTKKDEVIQENDERVEETVIIPQLQLEENYYKPLLPFKKSASRGLVADRVNHTKYDMKETEEGLLRLSNHHFNPKTHYFQEGQYITAKMAEAWLSSKDPAGLNPHVEAGMTEEEIAEKAPTYLAHIIEQNYYVMTDEKKVRLAGISIGLALNSIHYTRSGQETRIPDDVLETEGKKMGEEVINRLRLQPGLEEIPIVIGLFKQESRASIVPGSYFATAFVDKGKSSLSGWKVVDEQYVLFPAATNDERTRDTDFAFRNFKQEIDDYFPSFVNVIGRGLYQQGKITSLEIEMPIQFFGTSETIGFVQYVAELVMKYFPNIHTEVSVTSINGPEALIVKKAGKDEPYVHIYGY